MPDNVAITAGSGTTVAADEVIDGTLGTVKVQYVKLMDGTLDSTTKIGGAIGLPTTDTTATATATTIMQSAVAITGNGTSLPTTGYGTAVIQITGTFVATVNFEASVDAGATWTAISATQIGGASIANTATVTGTYRITCAGLDLIRARVTWTSGTSITVNGRATNAVNASKIVQIATGTSMIGNVGIIGTNAVNATIDNKQVDVHGHVLGVSRFTQVTAKFFQQSPSNFLNVSASGGATATGPTLGLAVFATSTATTASLLAQTPMTVMYTTAYEAWASQAAVFTTPTSAASFQRLGIYNTVNGYFFGFSGLTFGITVRSNSVDTFITKASWNADTLTGAVGSKFTSSGVPVALVPTNINMYRIRYGWYGSVSARLEVYSPDGDWVLVHTVRTANTVATANLTNPDLPMTVEVSKTAADATNLIISCGGWAAGITAPASGPLISGQGSIAALNAVVVVPTTGLASLSFAVSGTWVGTLSFQHSLDGLSWTADTTLNNVTGGFASTTTVNGAFTSAVGSYKFYRIVATAWTSGTAGIVYNGSSLPNFIISQSVITDGVGNGPVAVKLASTAALATDPSLVVALHPTSPLPTGANTIGAVNIAALQTIATVSTVTNLSQMGGVAISLNTGVRDTGTQRVTIATNDLVPVVLAAETTKIIGTVNNAIKGTYRASTIIPLVAAVTVNVPFFNIIGSATKTVTIKRINITGMTLTAVGYFTINVEKLSTASTAGTSTTLVATTLDTNNSAVTAVVKAYTAAPTKGTLVGTVASHRTLWQATVAAAAGITDNIIFEFGNRGDVQGIVLRGVAQELALTFPVVLASAGTLAVSVEWTEE